MMAEMEGGVEVGVFEMWYYGGRKEVSGRL